MLKCLKDWTGLHVHLHLLEWEVGSIKYFVFHFQLVDYWSVTLPWSHYLTRSCMKSKWEHIHSPTLRSSGKYCCYGSYHSIGLGLWPQVAEWRYRTLRHSVVTLLMTFCVLWSGLEIFDWLCNRSLSKLAWWLWVLSESQYPSVTKKLQYPTVILSALSERYGDVHVYHWVRWNILHLLLYSAKEC